MKRMKNILKSLTAAALLTGLAMNFNACSEKSPMSSQMATFSNEKGLKVLKFGDSSHSLFKKKNIKKWVTKASGGSLALEHGLNSGGDAGVLYGVSYNSPYNLYKIDPSDPGNPELAGQLAFKTKAIAVHPETGMVYYVSRNKQNGLYPFAVWDPATNANTILSSQNSIRPCDKLTFGSDGKLYAVDRDNKDDMYTIDTATGAWSFLGTFNNHLSAYGDMAFGNGVFYNVNGYNSKFQIIDLASNTLSTIDKTNLNDMSGIASGSDGVLYICRDNGYLYSVNTSTAQTTYLGNTGIADLEDLASPYFESELAFASVSLDIPANSISDDAEIELSLETTELLGGVAVTFEPHGITFSDPAVLNIEAHGVDFTGIDPNAVNVYYDNLETGQWELMQRDNIIIDVNAGTVRVINAKLPHFSRYAIGAE